MTYSVLDTFAGVGGFSLGFQLADARVIGAIEMDRWASETFQFNHPDATVMQGDITKMADEQIISAFGKHCPDIILGGPPCRGFSICNKNNGDHKDPHKTFRTLSRHGRFNNELVIEIIPPSCANSNITSNTKFWRRLTTEFHKSASAFSWWRHERG